MANSDTKQAAAKLDIVIPVYNEAETIAATLDAVALHAPTSHRVMLAHDTEGDTTLAAARGYAAAHPEIKLVTILSPAGGALNAIRKGLASATAEAVLVVMGDSADDLAAIPAMLDLIRGGADVVCGSRYMPGGRQIGGSLLKRTLSRLAGRSLRILAGVPTHDVTNSFKMYRTSMQRTIDIESRGGFEIGMEIVVKAHIAGYRIAETPSTWRERAADKSRFKTIQTSPYVELNIR